MYVKICFSTVRCVLALGLVLIVFGCSTDLGTNPQSESGISWTADKGGGSPNTYPQSSSRTYQYKNGSFGYDGGNIQLDNGSTFHIERGALSPPPGVPVGDPVHIVMSADLDPVPNEMLYTFGPEGCSFEPSAEIWMDYGDLGKKESPRLYYIDQNGDYILQTPDHIDYQGQRLSIRINHFSRYAVAFPRSEESLEENTPLDPVSYQTWYKEQMINMNQGGWIQCNHTRLVVPAGALEKNTKLSIYIEDSPVERLSNSITRNYTFGPHGTVFIAPVTLELSFSEADLNGQNPADLRIYYWNDDIGDWEIMGGTVDVQGEKVIFNGILHHFSRYALAISR